MQYKRVLLHLVALGFLCLPSRTASAGMLTGPIVNPSNGHSYYLLTQDNWTNSEAEAVTLGGHLATINDASEENWIYSTFSDYGNVDRNLWIGLYDPDPTHNSSDRITRESEFQWISGEPVTFTNWSPFEPSTGEFYVHIWNPTDLEAGKWNNANDNTSVLGIPLNGVVEVDPVPEPASLILFAIGLSGMVGYRWRRRQRVAC